MSDFDPAFVDVTIIGSKGGGSTDFIASIPIFSDGIDELEEGFIAMMEVLGGVSIILDEPRLTFVKIIDDDGKYLSFGLTFLLAHTYWCFCYFIFSFIHQVF